jgi:integrase
MAQKDGKGRGHGEGVRQRKAPGRKPERLSEGLVRSLKPPVKGNCILYDSDLKGFGIRVTAAGAKAFVLNYRAGGRERRYTIGSYPDPWSVAAAREKAEALKKEINGGRDPLRERCEERAAPTVADLAERFIAEYLPRKAKQSRREDAVMLRNDILPEIGALRVSDVTRADIRGIHRKVSQRAPIRANRVLSVASKAFNFAIHDLEWRDDNPCVGVRRNPENRRARYLSQAEIVALGKALAAEADEVGANAVRMLMLTGARRGEVINATWGQFDLEAGVWTRHSAHAKQRREHRVPVSAPALQLLAEMKRKAPKGVEWVFPGRGPAKPFYGIQKVWERVRRGAGLDDVRLHDIRHTYASIMVSAGVSLPMLGALLGHADPGATARYAHLYDAHLTYDPLREATERVGQVVTSRARDDAEVVPLRRGRS